MLWIMCFIKECNVDCVFDYDRGRGPRRSLMEPSRLRRLEELLDLGWSIKFIVQHQPPRCSFLLQQPLDK